MVMSRGALIGSCIGWMLLTFSLECIKALRYHFEKKIVGGDEFRTSWRLFEIPYLISCILYIPQMVLAYFIMLAAMSYNTPVFISIIAGFSIGNWAFAWQRIG